MTANRYSQLAMRLSQALWGWEGRLPPGGVLEQILQLSLTPEEVEVMMAIPVKPIPLDPVTMEEIGASSGRSVKELAPVLEKIVSKGLLFQREQDGTTVYSLLSQGYGFSQVFFWKGISELGQQVAKLESQPDYVAGKRSLFESIDTKVFRYIPVSQAIDARWQHVYPTETIEQVLDRAGTFALAHCPCRVKYEVVRGQACGHPLDVCMKLDELAEVTINAGLAREIDRRQAAEVIDRAVAAGLVHFVDNAGEGIKHICNCCGCACWTVGPTRRREVPRDALMATYFLRKDDRSRCSGCGKCVEACPVDVVRMTEDGVEVDEQWCIGCGLCVIECGTGAARLVDKEQLPVGAVDFWQLHTRVNRERSVLKDGDQDDPVDHQ